MIRSRSNPKKIIQKFKDQTQYYYEGWVKADDSTKKKEKLYKHSVGLLVDNIKEKKKLENKTVEIVEIIKEVPKEIVKEVIKEVEKIVKVPERVEVPVEVIKEVPYEVIKEVKVEVPVEKIVKVEVPVEKIVTKEVIKKVEVPVEIIKIETVEVPVIKEVTVIKEVEVFVDNPEVKKSYEKIIKDMENEQKKDFKSLKENFDMRVNLERLSKKAVEKRYQASLLLARELGKKEIMDSFAEMEITSKKYKRLFTYAYITTMIALPTFLGLIVCGKYLF